MEKDKYQECNLHLNKLNELNRLYLGRKFLFDFRNDYNAMIVYVRKIVQRGYNEINICLKVENFDKKNILKIINNYENANDEKIECCFSNNMIQIITSFDCFKRHVEFEIIKINNLNINININQSYTEDIVFVNHYNNKINIENDTQINTKSYINISNNCYSGRISYLNNKINYYNKLNNNNTNINEIHKIVGINNICDEFDLFKKKQEIKKINEKMYKKNMKEMIIKKNEKEKTRNKTIRQHWTAIETLTLIKGYEKYVYFINYICYEINYIYLIDILTNL